MNYILRNNELYNPGERKQHLVDLWNNHKKLFSMIYDVPLQSARFESNGIRRVFMVYREGKRQPKITLKNEYGFDVGVISTDVNDPVYGRIELFGDLFYYNLACHTEKELHIYHTLDSKPVLDAQLQISSGVIADRGRLQLPADFFSALLFGLCWYIQIPAENTESIVTPGFFHTDRSGRRL